MNPDQNIIVTDKFIRNTKNSYGWGYFFTVFFGMQNKYGFKTYLFRGCNDYKQAKEAYHRVLNNAVSTSNDGYFRYWGGWQAHETLHQYHEFYWKETTRQGIDFLKYLPNDWWYKVKLNG